MRHNGHIRPRSENSFEIRYSLGNDPVTGKWKVKTVTFKGTRKEAQNELQRILKGLDEGGYVEPTKQTAGEYLKQWINSIKSQVSPKTHDRYADIVNYFLIPTFGHYPLNKLTPSIIQNAYNAWETTGRRDMKKGGLSPRTRLHMHRIFSSSLKDAVRLQLIIRNPADAVKSPRPKKAAITTLTIEHSADGNPLWPSSVTHEFIKAIKKLPNLPRVRFHDLRHSHATQLLMEGVHPKIAQERLGHSTISTTLEPVHNLLTDN